MRQIKLWSLRLTSPHEPKSRLTKLAAWTTDRNIPFRITSLGMIVMLLWAGSYKMTAPGAEGIFPWFRTAR